MRKFIIRGLAGLTVFGAIIASASTLGGLSNTTGIGAESASVTSCDTDGVQTTAGGIDAATVIWAAGVQASPAGNWIGTTVDRALRVEVRPDPSIADAPNIFAIGDTARVVRPDGTAVPGIAPAAKQMGQYVGQLIAARVECFEPPGPLLYKHYGDPATLLRATRLVVHSGP